MKQPSHTRTLDQDRLQQIMHYHGLTEFKELLKQAYYNTSDEMQDIDPTISEQYRDEANRIED